MLGASYWRYGRAMAEESLVDGKTQERKLILLRKRQEIHAEYILQIFTHNCKPSSDFPAR